MASQAVPIAVFGASGRMGRALIRLSAEVDSAVICRAALVRKGDPLVGQSVPESATMAQPLRYTDRLDPKASLQVIVDFSRASAFDEVLDLATAQGLALVSGTTGISDRQMAAAETAAQRIALLWSPNFSLGIAVLQHLVAHAAQHLGADFDIDVLELHHRHKRDAPSGTALALSGAAAHGRGIAPAVEFVFNRSIREQPRGDTEIGFAVLRGGDVVGEHTVLFTGPGERLELIHRATHRDVFARGALRAAAWLVRQPSGRHNIGDMFVGLTT